MKKKLGKVLSMVLSLSLLFQQTSFAQMAAELNLAAYLPGFSHAASIDKFRPLHLRYFAYDELKNSFNLLLDKGDLKNAQVHEINLQSQDLFKYFLIGISLPNESFWVNLRPDTDTQIIDPYLEQTDIGKVLLEADLQLKKDTALFTSPQNPKGKLYWDKLYQKAYEIFGQDNISIPTLTRPWIVPGEVILRYTPTSAYVYKATLKVMLEQDYLKDSAVYSFKDPRMKALNEYSSELIRELIIPQLTKEVNTSKRYAKLRQVYYSLTLAQWFKTKFSGTAGTYAKMIDSRNLDKLTSSESWSKNTYFNAYKKSFADGEYNIKEPAYSLYGQTIRSYFSGGAQFSKIVPVAMGVAGGNLPTESAFLRNGGLRVTAGPEGVAASPEQEQAAEVVYQKGKLVIRVEKVPQDRITIVILSSPGIKYSVKTAIGSPESADSVDVANQISAYLTQLNFDMGDGVEANERNLLQLPQLISILSINDFSPKAREDSSPDAPNAAAASPVVITIPKIHPEGLKNTPQHIMYFGHEVRYVLELIQQISDGKNKMFVIIDIYDRIGSGEVFKVVLEGTKPLEFTVQIKKDQYTGAYDLGQLQDLITNLGGGPWTLTATLQEASATSPEKGAPAASPMVASDHRNIEYAHLYEKPVSILDRDVLIGSLSRTAIGDLEVKIETPRKKPQQHFLARIIFTKGDTESGVESLVELPPGVNRISKIFKEFSESFLGGHFSIDVEIIEVAASPVTLTRKVINTFIEYYNNSPIGEKYPIEVIDWEAPGLEDDTIVSFQLDERKIRLTVGKEASPEGILRTLLKRSQDENERTVGPMPTDKFHRTFHENYLLPFVRDSASQLLEEAGTSAASPIKLEASVTIDLTKPGGLTPPIIVKYPDGSDAFSIYEFGLPSNKDWPDTVTVKIPRPTRIPIDQKLTANLTIKGPKDTKSIEVEFPLRRSFRIIHLSPIAKLKEDYGDSLEIKLETDIVSPATPGENGAASSVASSPAVSNQEQSAVGGIDLRYINMVTEAQMIKMQESLQIPALNVLKDMNLSEENTALQKLMAAGIMPSSQRVIEYVSASYVQHSSEEEMNGAVICLIDFFKLEEETTTESTPAMRAFLALIESDKLPI